MFSNPYRTKNIGIDGYRSTRNANSSPQAPRICSNQDGDYPSDIAFFGAPTGLPVAVQAENFEPLIAIGLWLAIFPVSAILGSTIKRRSLNFDQGCRAARLRIIENADYEPPCPPRQRVEIGAARVKQRAFGEIVVAVHDVKAAEA